MKLHSTDYSAGNFHDELIDTEGNARPHARLLAEYFSEMQPQELVERQRAVDSTIVDMGISFTIYSQGDNIDRAWPLDIIPRAMPGSEWDQVERGLIQRLKALNLFIDDLYNERRILKDKIVPAELIDSSKNYLAPCRGVSPKHGVWAHICGSDLVRDGDGTIYVLEDNLRVPSGVSYMLENRNVIKRVFPSMFRNHRDSRRSASIRRSLSDAALASHRTTIDGKPEIVVLTPGIYNSAYFEHSYLARTMGVELVEGSDLVVDDDDCVYMRTIDGLKRVDTIYRRIDDTFIDPEAFRPDSMLGVPGHHARLACRQRRARQCAGLRRRRRQGHLLLRARDHSLLPGRGRDPAERADLALFGSSSSWITCSRTLPILSSSRPTNRVATACWSARMRRNAEHEKFRELLKADPRNYIAQPTLDRCRRHRRSATTHSNRGISTCGRSSCRAATCRSRPAA